MKRCIIEHLTFTR